MKKQKHVNQREKMILRKLVRSTLIAFIAFNVIFGGILEATSSNVSKGDTNSISMKDSSRDALQIISTNPVVVIGPEKEEVVTELDVSSSEEEGITTESTLESEAEQTPELTPDSATNQEIEPTTKETVGITVLGEDTESGLKITKITSESTTAERIDALFEFLISEGFTPEAAAGVIGNVAVESCFDPTWITEAGYYGLFQWNTNAAGAYWWYSVEDWITSNGYHWDSFEGQTRAMLYCPKRGFLTDERLEELKNLKNVEQATELFAVFYESCIGGEDVTRYYQVGSNYQAIDTRKSEAWVAYQMYQTTSSVYNGVKPYN